MDPSGAGSSVLGVYDCGSNGYVQPARNNVSSLETGPEPPPEASAANCRQTCDMKQEILPKEERGWRRLIRNFTPS
jgi:hypothetical protein